jgi:hypothetical protein
LPVLNKFLSEIARIQRSAFSLSTGIRAAAIAMTPLVIGLGTGQLVLLYATIGAMFVTSTEGPPIYPLPLRVLVLACFTESAAFALGVLASAAGSLAIPLAGVGVFIALMAGGDETFTQVGTNTAIAFAVAIGLPGGSTAVALQSLWLFLIGGAVGPAGCLAGSVAFVPKMARSERCSRAFEHPGKKIFQAAVGER